MVDTPKSTGLKKDGTPKAARGEGGKPRPAYLAYKPTPDGKIEVVLATRNAEALLAVTSGAPEVSYIRFEIK